MRVDKQTVTHPETQKEPTIQEFQERIKELTEALEMTVDGQSSYDLSESTGYEPDVCQEKIINVLYKNKNILNSEL